MSDWIRITGFCVAPHIGGVFGGMITSKQVKTWYKTLKRPSWNPPDWVFGPVWATLYTGMGYASYLVWRDGNGFEGDGRLPLMLYGTQLALNWLWTPIFFGAHKLGLATLEIAGLWTAVAGCVFTFHSVNKTASYLMVPYLAWVSLASALTFNIWQNNPEKSE